MKCSLCETQQDLFHQEKRQCGREGKIQNYYYCPQCWTMLQNQRQDQNPEIAARYRIFLKYITENSTRRINGNRAKRAMWKVRS